MVGRQRWDWSLLFAFIRAPVKQRDEARRYAKAVEALAADYREWAARQQIASDFFDNEFQRANAVEYMWTLVRQEQQPAAPPRPGELA